MRNDDYIHIQGWMVNKLKLRGNKLIAYAIVHGFSKDGESEFKGSLGYLQKALNCSRRTAIDTMNFLEEEGMIFKRKIVLDKIERNRYSISVDYVKKLYGGSVETSHGGSVETSHKNTNKGNTNKETKAKKNIRTKEYLDSLKNTFKENLDLYRREHSDKYDSKLIREFYEYWTSLDYKKKIFKFETVQIFDIGRRLATWKRFGEKNKQKKNQDRL